IDPSRVLNITSHLSASGKLSWSVPSGKWVVIRYGMMPTGVTNGPATPEGQGYEVDKMSKTVLGNHFNSFVGMIQNKLTAEEKKSLKWVVADSYETGSQNWTDDLAAAFKKVYGYDPLVWMPVLSGRVVGTENQSDRFLWDLRRLIADRVSYQYVGGLRDISHNHGLKLWLENYGHWGFPGEFLQYGGQSDEVSGEFWNEGTLGSIECKAASSSAHIYGKKKVAAESFTAAGLAYLRYPALLKKRADWSFTEGINSTLLHVMIEQPSESKQPGINAGFGTEFNRHNTWFSQIKPFCDYLKRSNYLLQQGLVVNDAAYFIGEDVPKMTGVRDPALPKGYSFDYINAEVILKRLSVKNGRFVLPDGMSYKLLVLPKLETMRPELLQKIKQLVAGGGTILGPAPLRSPSLQNYPASDNAISSMASQVWGSADNKKMYGAFGKGTVISGMTMEQAFDLLKVKPDFQSNTSDTVLYIHRTTASGEIYFVTNQTDKTLEFSPEFRIKNKQPALWDAVTATTRVLHEYNQTADGTVVPMKLAPYESAFIVFNGAPKEGSNHTKNFVSSTALRKLSGGWTVQFDPGSGGSAGAVVFDKLEDWTTRKEENIKNYSGAAVYKTSFNFTESKAGEHIYLDLGKVMVMATVTLNGKKMGTVWTAPWRIEVTGSIKKGENLLEIKVVNTLVNRMIGDRKKPDAERKVWSNVDPYTSESAYHSSGLIGPVTLQSEGSDSLGTMRYLMNGKIKIGIDLNLGGAITYMSSRKDSINMINNWDWGRQVQMSFYSGPVPFEPDGKKANKAWTFIGWNPIQSGDVAGNRSKVLEYKNDGKEIYVKCIPMHWPLDNVPGECTYECWITLDGNAAKVRSRIVNNRPDRTQYPARGQELPAVYTNAPFHKLITYKGSKPFTNDGISLIKNHNDPRGANIRWESWQATESWAANVNEKGIGLGVYNPDVQRFSGGYYGDSVFVGGSKNIATAYIAPNSMDILDYNIGYDYHYVLIAGSTDEIRQYVYSHKNSHLPSYDFKSDRQQWYYENTADSGWPVQNGLNISLAKNASAIGPVSLWKAVDGGTARIQGSWPAGVKQARIYWRSFGDKEFSERKSVLFDVMGDGKEHTYNVKLNGSPEYTGDIAQLKILLSGSDAAKGNVVLRAVKILL
ncbi:MAG: hypothetical protein H0X41_07250, partial [Chitinophagaceae bacterium]|nr:hypothetical protein [Chitinophagaceae bacterium]